MSYSNLRILVIADNLLARAGLAALLAEQPNCLVVAQSSGGEDLQDRIADHQPDIILIDLGWNLDDSLEIIETLSDNRTLVALVPNDDDVGDIAAALMPFGAYGLLLRESEPETLVAAMQAVVNGLVVIDPSLTLSIFPGNATNGDTPSESLTPRESEVLQLLAQGMTNKAIAHRLSITEHTVKFHVNAIMGKLNAQSRTDAVVRASRSGLIIL